MESLASKLMAEAADVKRIASNDPAIAVTVMVALAAKLNRPPFCFMSEPDVAAILHSNCDNSPRRQSTLLVGRVTRPRKAIS